MNTTSDMKESMLEFPWARLAGKDASVAYDSATHSGMTESSSRAEGSLDGALSGVGQQRGLSEGWFRRGIPELASPLAG